MRSFACGHCGPLVVFEDTVRRNRSAPLGFDPQRLDMAAPPARGEPATFIASADG